LYFSKSKKRYFASVAFDYITSAKELIINTHAILPKEKKPIGI
jgi:hypothetical protein